MRTQNSFVTRDRLLASVVSLATVLCVIGCATERLAASAPKGVDLTGEWQLDTNLSDDPTKAMEDGRGRSPNGGMRRRGGRGGGGAGGRGSSVPGSDDFTSTATNTRGSTSCGGQRASGRRGGGGVGQLLSASDHLAIDQNGGKITIQRKGARGELTTDEYSFGDKSSVTLGPDTAERTTGWKGSVFVIDTKAKGGPSKEEDFALDDEGHLIVTTFLSGSRVPKVEIKRVYDRDKAK